MPLVVATLQQALADLFKSRPPSGAEFAKKFAQAYDDYAKNAQLPPGGPVFTGSEKGLMEAAVAPALASPLAGAPPIIAAAIASGYTQYWMSPPVVCMAPQPPIPQTPACAYLGAVTVAPGAATLIPSLTAIFSNLGNTEDTCAQQVAAALDAATKMVVIQMLPLIPPMLPPPAPPPPPIIGPLT